MARATLAVGGHQLVRDFAINKAPAPAIAFPAPTSSIEYGQQLQEVELEYGDNAYGSFSWEDPETLPEVGSDGYELLFRPNDLLNYDWADLDGATDPSLMGPMQWDEGEGVLRGIVKVDVTKTSNDWLVEPAISGWAYGESPVLSDAQAKFGDVKATYAGTANDGTQWDGSFPPFKAGSYFATYTVDETANYEGLKVEIPFTVARADLDMSQVKWNYEAPFAYDGREHTVKVEGLPNGVKVEGYTGNVATEIGDYTAKVELSYDQDNCNVPVPVQDLSWSIVDEAPASPDGEDADKDAEKPESGKDSAKDKDSANLLKEAKSASVPTGDELLVTAPLASLALGSLVVALAVRRMRGSF